MAREAADLVLLNDAFDAIVEGIRMGGRVFDNLRKAMAYIIAVHLPIAGISLLPLILESYTQRAWPNDLMPIHIVFLELIIDPACSVVFEVEPDESGLMKRTPRKAGTRLFETRLITIALAQGLIAFMITASLYAYAISRGMSEEILRGLTFASLVFGNMGLLLVNRSWSDSLIYALGVRNIALWWVLGGSLLTLGTALYWPVAQRLFHLMPPNPEWILWAMAGAAASGLWFEIFKAFNRYREATDHEPSSRRRVKSKKRIQPIKSKRRRRRLKTHQRT